MAAVVCHASQEKLLQFGLCVRRHDQGGGPEVLGLPADDAPDRVRVDLGLDEVDHRVGTNGEQPG